MDTLSALMTPRSVLEGLIDKPVFIRTLTDPYPKYSAYLFDVRDGFLEVIHKPGKMVVIALSMVVSIEIDYTEVGGDRPWEYPPEGSALYPAAKRKLFEAEQARVVGLPEEKADAMALEAEALFRVLRGQYPQHKGIERTLAQARLLVTGEASPEADAGVKGGEVDLRNYRRAKKYAEKLEEALKGRQDEEKVTPLVIALALHAGNGLSKYPAHADLRAWFDKAEGVRKKLSEATRKELLLEEPFVAGDAPPKTGLYAEGGDPLPI